MVSLTDAAAEEQLDRKCRTMLLISELLLVLVAPKCIMDEVLGVTALLFLLLLLLGLVVPLSSPSSASLVKLEENLVVFIVLMGGTDDFSRFLFSV